MTIDIKTIWYQGGYNGQFAGSGRKFTRAEVVALIGEEATASMIAKHDAAKAAATPVRTHDRTASARIGGMTYNSRGERVSADAAEWTY